MEAWVVLGPGESVGGRSNRGCRLTNAEIRDFLTQLSNNRRVFGGNIDFVLPQNVLNAVDSQFYFQQRPYAFNFFRDHILANYWTDGKLNIYFAGAYQTLPPIGLPQAISCDPAGYPPFGRSFILLNDGGMTQGSGFVPNLSPAEVLSYFVLEHEVAHFFLRRDGYGEYDDAEHIPCRCPSPDPPCARNDHLLDGCGVPYGSPDPVWPFNLTIPFSEKREIWCRVWEGVWLQASPECGPPAR
ncbi:MAG TPA: hypothetical protein VM243_00865 [Phycisphaerae bacterium]|nr:hypothetical protein [Phycisphaerae bacterium]